MQAILTHPWDLTGKEAVQLQRELADKVIHSNQLGEVKLVAGTDVSYQKQGDLLVAAVVVLDAESLEVVETVTVTDQAQFPYVPGLFSFRELPPLAKAFEQLNVTPDLVVCDGQGIAHPRRFGLASHLGVMFDLPTIGCGKTRLCGEEVEPENERGAQADLIHKDEHIGYILRTRTKVKPVYVSLGHKVDAQTACDWVLKLAPKYRLPETTRKADKLVGDLMKAMNQ